MSINGFIFKVNEINEALRKFERVDKGVIMYERKKLSN